MLHHKLWGFQEKIKNILIFEKNAYIFYKNRFVAQLNENSFHAQLSACARPDGSLFFSEPFVF